MKLWLCGGRILEVPCSRVGHCFRKHFAYRQNQGFDFETYNFKRIAEVMKLRLKMGNRTSLLIYRHH